MIEKKLQHTNIQIDYSFKGATPREYYWSQKKNLPSTVKNNNDDFELQNHPQYKGYKNIAERMEKLFSKYDDFNQCVSLTVEKGIDHYKKNKLYVYNQQAFDWDMLVRKTGIKFSDVINHFDLSYRWNFRAKLFRYANAGAITRMSDGQESADIENNSPDELQRFRMAHYRSPNFVTLVYPVMRTVIPKRTSKTRQLKMEDIPTEGTNFWVLTGAQENLMIGIKDGLWGVDKELEELWNKVKPNDKVFFYCTRPVSGIVGEGRVIKLKRDVKPHWPNEDPRKPSKYPLRIIFEVTSILDNNEWRRKRMSLYRTGIEFYRGLNFVKPYQKNFLNDIDFS